jgi:predicted N-acetyltransferase YhbS
MPVTISHIPDDLGIMHTVAQWSINAWGDDFPDDSINTYVDLYQTAISDQLTLPCVFVAWNDDMEPVGTITLIENDDLPDATEPGPWLAALYVAPEYRKQGVGHVLVDMVTSTARSLGHEEIYLYTSDKVDWYLKIGWNTVRAANLANHQVMVMQLQLNFMQ